jgi:hypothetical protein
MTFKDLQRLIRPEGESGKNISEFQKLRKEFWIWSRNRNQKTMTINILGENKELQTKSGCVTTKSANLPLTISLDDSYIGNSWIQDIGYVCLKNMFMARESNIYYS